MRNYRIALVHHRPFPREEGRGAFASPPLPPLRARRLTPCAASADSFFRQRSGDSRSISRTASLAGFNFAKWLTPRSDDIRAERLGSAGKVARTKIIPNHAAAASENRYVTRG